MWIQAGEYSVDSVSVFVADFQEVSEWQNIEKSKHLSMLKI